MIYLVLHPARNWSLEPSASHHCVVKISRRCHRIAVEILPCTGTKQVSPNFNSYPDGVLVSSKILPCLLYEGYLHTPDFHLVYSSHFSLFSQFTSVKDEVAQYNSVNNAKTREHLLTSFLSSIPNRLSKFFGKGWSKDFLVQEKGLEPSRHCCHRHLKPARLPIPPFLHKTDKNYNTIFEWKSQEEFKEFLRSFY